MDSTATNNDFKWKQVRNVNSQFLSRKIALAVSLIALASSLNAQPIRAHEPRSRNGLSDEFVLERISGRDNPEQISDSYAIQFFAAKLLNSEPARIKSTLSELEITDEQSAELKKIANASIFSNDRNVQSGMSSICQSAEYQTILRERKDAQRLSNLMTDLEEHTSEAYEAFFKDQVTKSLGAEFYINLMAWMDENIKPKLTSVKIDHVKRAAALNRDLFHNFEIICQEYGA